MELFWIFNINALSADLHKHVKVQLNRTLGSRSNFNKIYKLHIYEQNIHTYVLVWANMQQELENIKIKQIKTPYQIYFWFWYKNINKFKELIEMCELKS